MAPETRHALLTREAIAAGRYAQFFKLYKSAPHLSRALLDIILPKIRFTFLKMLAKTFLPVLPVAKVALWLGFCCVPESGPSVSPEAPLPGASKSRFAGKHDPKASLLSSHFRISFCTAQKRFCLTEAVLQADMGEALRDCQDWLQAHGALLVETAGPTHAPALPPAFCT